MDAGNLRFGLKRSYQLALIIGLVLLIRLPFLWQAIGGDDPYYLYGAEHAQINPAHPHHARYLFQGEMVDMRGHPHPPGNAWMLAGLLAAMGDVYEAPFHAAYIVFSLIAAVAMFFLASKFTEHAFIATLLFVAVPAFVVNGNTLETDVPFLAFWTAGFACFVWGRLAAAAVCFVAAALTAYQAVVATPILAVYCWYHARTSRAAWLVCVIPCLTVGAFQLYERLSSDALPAAVLAGYFSSYGLQQIANKLRNAAALTAHAGWMVSPLLMLAVVRCKWLVGVAAAAGYFIDPHPLFFLSFGVGAGVLASCVRFQPDFLRWWILLFFAAALVLFFAGSARYLLPMAAPLAIVAANEIVPRVRRPLLWTAIGLHLVLGLALALVNYQHWDGYRQFAAALGRESEGKRVWVNGELGMRFYLESAGALPLEKNRAPQPGEMIVTSGLTSYADVQAPTAPLAARQIQPSLPLRLIGLNARSGYSSAALGLRPFDVTDAPIDTLRADVVLERKPTLSFLTMNAAEAPSQLVSGVFKLEEGRWRWVSERSVVLLKPPPSARPLEISLYVPPASPARSVRVLLDNQLVHEQTFASPGPYEIATKPASGSAVTIEWDRSFSVPPDRRALSAIISSIGFR